MEPILSICIPIYNRSVFLSRMLERFLEDKDLFEEKVRLYVSDNASEEDLSSIAASFRAEGLRLEYFRQETNIGADRNIRSCYLAGRGRYTWVLGSDDVPLPGFLRKLVVILEQEKDYGLVHLCHYRRSKQFTRVYDDADRFISDVHVWLTFISANIVSTGYIPQIDLDLFASSSVGQVPLFIEAVSGASANLVVYGSWQEKETDAASGGWYNIFQVFGEDLPNLLHDALWQGKLSRKAYKRAKRRIYRDFLTENIVNFLILHRKPIFNIENGWKIVRRQFGKELYFIPDLAGQMLKLGFGRLCRHRSQ